MAKSRDVYRRMKSVDNTRKITRTMEMVSTSKLRRAQIRVVQARPYSQGLSDVIERLATRRAKRCPEYREQESLILKFAALAAKASKLAARYYLMGI